MREMNNYEKKYLMNSGFSGIDHLPERKLEQHHESCAPPQ